MLIYNKEMLKKGTKRVSFLKNILEVVLRIQTFLTRIKSYNYQEQRPAIFAMWHCNQLAIVNIKDREKTNILISRSVDGDIIANTAESYGYKTIRGSQNKSWKHEEKFIVKDKGGTHATFEMIEKLNVGENVAITVDGPVGPAKKVKKGIAKIAKQTKVPIIPITYYSPDFNFISLPTWDKFKIPIGPARVLVLYGEPIFINEEESDEDLKNKVKNALDELDRIAPEKFREMF